MGVPLRNRHPSRALLGALAILITLFISLISQHNTASVYATHSLSMTSSGAQSIDVAPGSNSRGTSIGVDNITVSTNCKAGYNFSISTSVNDNNLYLNGSSSNNASDTYFSPADGVATLAESTNRWGYLALPSTSSAPNASNVFNAVPTFGNASLVRSAAETASETDINDSFNIYYGVSLANNLTPGKYKMIPDTNNNNQDGTVVYYVTMSTSCHEPYMQDVTISDLNQMMLNIGDSTTLADKRDGQNYTVAKLADGKFWMTKNLNLAGGTALSSEDTDFDASYALPTTQNWTVSDDKLVMPASSKSGFDADNYAYVFNSDSTDCSSADGCYSYYSWDAATLGSGRSITTDNTDAPYSICPKGWRLPTSGSDSNNGWKRGDFYTLATAYGANLESQHYHDTNAFSINAGPNTIPNFLFTGSYYDSSFDNGGLAGVFWSSTSRSDASLAYYLSYSSTGINVANIGGRAAGFAVRCIKTIEEAEYMQNQTTSTLAQKLPNAGDTTTLYDKRDDQDYTVAKLADGKYWMTKNMNIAGGTTLTSELTDFDSSYTIPSDGNWQAGGTLPASSTSGFSTNNYAYVYNSGNNTSNCANSGCYSYYSWDAATLGSGRTIATDNTDALYSICPKGWKLPTSGGQSNDGWKRGDYYALATAYGSNLENSYVDNSSSTGGIFTSQAGPGTVANFLYNGNYYGDNSFTADGGNYWSSTSTSNVNEVYRFGYSAGYDVNLSVVNFRGYGQGVRCLKRGEYTIHYNANGGSGEMSDQVAYVGTANTLNANTFTGPSATPFFTGWNTAADGSGISYSNEANVTNIASANSTITLYAQWTDKLYMQNFTVSQCNALASSENFTVYDKRDEQAYTVRYISGRCWMTRNLAIGCNGSGTTYSASRRTITLTKDDSNVSSSYTMNTTNIQNINSSNTSYISGYTTAAMACNATYGGYYNYKAATAGTITGGSNSTKSTYDICPNGWRLPSSNEYGNLTKGNFSPVYSGYYGSGSLSDVGSRGIWWASDTGGDYATTARYNFVFYNSNLAGNGGRRFYGYSVRCMRSN